jgi:phytoene dehydrogenase-like protein
MLDFVVVGSGPNGLAAALTLAEAGHTGLVLEAADTPGGGTRSAELTLPGVVHDVCSAVHPFGIASPFFAARDLPGLEWSHPEIPLAHPLDDGTAGLIHRSLDDTVAGLGEDGRAWRRTVGPMVRHWDDTVAFSLSPALRALKRPIAGARFGMTALRPASWLARRFRTPAGRGLWAGLAAHSVAPLNGWATSGVAVSLAAAAHAVGWPFATGGSQRIADALVSRLDDLGVEVRTGTPVGAMPDVPQARAVLFDTSPAAVAEVAGNRLGRGTRRAYRRVKRAPGSFKVDVTMDAPVPWTAEPARRAGTVHIGGTWEEIAASERAAARGEHAERPFVIAAQPTGADPSRAPDGTHVLWAYCHVPTGSTVDMTERILDQVERFAPGFRGTISQVAVHTPAMLEEGNPNNVGGDITGGALTLSQVLARPRLFRPYRAGEGLYLCSSSAPPGAGVHGMCGYWAAQEALKRL